MRRWIFCLGIASCAPQLDGPIEQQRRVDAEDSLAVKAQLETLPDVVAASVELHRAAHELDRHQDADAHIVLVVRGSPGEAQELARAIVPGARVEAMEWKPATVEAASARPYKLALAGALAVIAGLAALLAWLARKQRPVV